MTPHVGLWLEGFVAQSENLGCRGFIWEVIPGDTGEDRKWEQKELIEQASLSPVWAAGAQPCWEPLTGGGDTPPLSSQSRGRERQVCRPLPACRGELSGGCSWGAVMLQQWSVPCPLLRGQTPARTDR